MDANLRLLPDDSMVYLQKDFSFDIKIQEIVEDGHAEDVFNLIRKKRQESLFTTGQMNRLNQIREVFGKEMLHKRPVSDTLESKSDLKDVSITTYTSYEKGKRLLLEDMEYKYTLVKKLHF